MNLTEVTNDDLNGLFNLKTAKIYKNGIVVVGQYAFEDLQLLERSVCHTIFNKRQIAKYNRKKYF